MKTQLLSLVICIVALSVNSCKKQDDTADSIELIGPYDITIFCGANYVDPGANVLNSKGDIIAKAKSNWTNQVNYNACGTYIVSYSLPDNDVNEIQTSRRVTVAMGQDCYSGEYDCKWLNPGNADSLSCITTISKGTNLNEIAIQNLGDVGSFNNVRLMGQFGDSVSYYYSTSNTGWWYTKSLIGGANNFGKNLAIKYSFRHYSVSDNSDKIFILNKR